jgi:hypothetical protein
MGGQKHGQASAVFDLFSCCVVLWMATTCGSLSSTAHTERQLPARPSAPLATFPCSAPGRWVGLGASMLVGVLDSMQDVRMPAPHVTLRLRGAGRGGRESGRGTMVSGHRSRGGRGGRGDVMVTGAGRMVYAGKGKDDVLEWVKKKRLKQVLRNQRKHREEILEKKQLDKQTGILSAIVLSQALEDQDYYVDQQRVYDALKQYDLDSRYNETEVWVGGWCVCVCLCVCV